MKSEKTSKLLERLEAGYSLPALSPVAFKLVELAADDRSSVKDLVALIEKDPSLAVRLLRLANSAFFGSLSPVKNLHQAVVRVGFQRLRIMALSISLRDAFPMGRIGPLDYEKFWRISLYRALFARSISERLEPIDSGEAFLASLVLEIGLPIFFDLFLRDQEDEALPELDPLSNLLSWESERFGIHHRQVGKAALTFWRFPFEIVECQIPPVEEDQEAPSSLAKLCTSVVRLSKSLFSKDLELGDMFQEAERFWGISPDAVNEVLGAAFDQVEETARVLNLFIDKEKDLLDLMEKANLALARISEKISKADIDSPAPPLPSFESLNRRQRVVANTLQAVAHEIRNPLLAVGGLARRLGAAMDSGSEGGKVVQMILQEVSRLEGALSEMSRIGEMPSK